MEHDFAPFIDFWSANEAAFIRDLVADLVTALPNYASLPREQLVGSIQRKNELWQQLLLTGNTTPILERTQMLVQQRMANDFPLLEMINTGDMYRDHLWRMLRRFYVSDPLPIGPAEQIERWVRVDRNVLLHAYSLQLQQTRAELAERISRLEQQAALIRDLSMPVIPLVEHVIAMPLIGALDPQRVEQIMATLLAGVTTHRATTAILDVTGVQLIDTQAANGIIQTAEAVKLLGAQVILTGIRPEVAQTLIGLGIDLSGIRTRATLQDGISAVLRRLA